MALERVNSISPDLFKSEITQGLMQKDWMNSNNITSIRLFNY